MLRHLGRYGAAWRLSKAFVACAMFAVPVAADPVRLVALGDSLTQGYGLVEQDGFVPQLRRWLAARGHDVEIMNAGVSGDTTAGGLARVDWSLEARTDAMIVALGGNDLLRGIAPEVARSNIDGILSVAQARDIDVLLIGMQAPGNYGPDYKAEFDAIYPDLAAQYGTLYLGDFFAGLRQDGEMPADIDAVMQSDGIHPNSNGVSQIVEAVGPQVEALIGRVQAGG